MILRRLGIGLAAVGSCLFHSSTMAASSLQPGEASRLTIGGGFGVLSRPDYRGSAETDSLALPLPYVAYENRKLQLTREGLVAKLLNLENLQIRLSGSGALPGNDSEQTTRRGMPELLPTFELGPSLDWRFSERGGDWELRLPVRAAVASDLSETESIGWIANPNLHFERERQHGAWEVETSASIGPVWASRKYHRYFYQVETRYALPDRPAYDPGGGYSGLRGTAYMGLRRGPWRFGLRITHDRLDGARFEDSPLVERDSSTVIGVGLFYTFWTWIRPIAAE